MLCKGERKLFLVGKIAQASKRAEGARAGGVEHGALAGVDGSGSCLHAAMQPCSQQAGSTEEESLLLGAF